MRLSVIMPIRELQSTCVQTTIGILCVQKYFVTGGIRQVYDLLYDYLLVRGIAFRVSGYSILLPCEYVWNADQHKVGNNISNRCFVTNKSPLEETLIQTIL